VAAIAKATGMAGSDIGTIHIFDSHTFVDLPEGLSTAHQRRLNQTQINGRSLRVTPQSAVGQFQGGGSGPQPGRGGPSKKGRRPLRQ
jgi:ATP-dependent RNA helicase DeaD